MFGSQKIDSISQMCTENGQNKKKYAGGGGTVRINGSFTIHFSSISKISIFWSFFDYASGKTTRRYVLSGGESREK